MYDTAIRALIAGWKERGVRGVVRLAADIVGEVVPPPAVHAVAFVPPDPERALLRGHYPAEALARELADLWTIELLPLLDRSRAAPRQAGLRLAERRRNVAGAFQAAGRAPTRVALVDDVYTTGSTVASAASALRRAGARRVDVVTFARAIR
jgi:predicted amidophosphoribosyltransferase